VPGPLDDGVNNGLQAISLSENRVGVIIPSAQGLDNAWADHR